jgi:uncharacterized protein (TIGR02266 family)
MADDDRRQEKREPISLVVDYEGADHLIGDYTANLSRGGTFIETEHAFEVGTEVNLRLSFPGLLRPIALAGVVRWVRLGEGRGVGIEFHDYDDGVGAELAKVIEAVRRRDADVVKRIIRILVVEDNPHVARLIEDGLRKHRFRNVEFDFTVSNDGHQALSNLESNEYDAAIIDMYLPVMDGSHLIAHIRRTVRTSTMPIVAVSAGGPPARKEAFEAGADLFLDKPMRLRQIVDSMVTLVGLKAG